MGDGKEAKDNKQKQVLDTDAFLDLNFVPQWARRPPNAVHASRYRDHEDNTGKSSSQKPHHRDHTRRDRNQRDQRNRKDRRQPNREADTFSRKVQPKDAQAQPSTERQRPHHTNRTASSSQNTFDGRRNDAAAPGFSQANLLEARFLPERKAISEVAKRVAATHKAYPLLDLAALLLAREGLCYVRLEIADDNTTHNAFFQCQRCRTVSLERETIENHIIQDHLEDFFDIETETLEPPTGVFTCVAICGLSNQFLGPPNHHSYQEAIKQIHTQQYSHIPLDTYRSRIRISHEPEDVERWKNACTTQTIYRPKTEEQKEDAETLTLREAQRFMLQKVIEHNIKSARKVVLQENEAHTIRDRVIRSALHHAWQRELRFPIHTALALRAALRNRHLHVFKAGTGKGIHFVTAVQPTPLDPNVAVPAIRDTLRYLKDHPGCTREEILQDLLGHVDHESPQAKELLQPISWLTERGHIIEFFNGRLAVPR